MSWFAKLSVGAGVVLMILLASAPLSYAQQGPASPPEQPVPEQPAVPDEDADEDTPEVPELPPQEEAVEPTEVAGDQDQPELAEFLPEKGFYGGKEANSSLKFEPLAPLPRPIRGAFMGTLDGIMIVAGGVGYIPETGSLSNCEFLDTIYYMSPGESGRHIRWRRSPLQLPAATAFGATAITEQGMACLGGWTPDGVTNRVFRLTWQKEEDLSKVLDEIIKADEDAEKQTSDEEEEDEQPRFLRYSDGEFIEVEPDALSKFVKDEIKADELSGTEYQLPEEARILLKTGRLAVWTDGGLFDIEDDSPVELEETTLVELPDGQILQVRSGKVPGHFELKQGVEWDEEDDVWKGLHNLPEPLAFASAKVMQDDYSEDFHLYVVGGYRPPAPDEEAADSETRPTAATQTSEDDKSEQAVPLITLPVEDNTEGTLSDVIYRCLLPKKIEYTGVINRVKAVVRSIREDARQRRPDWETVHNRTPDGEEVSPLSGGVMLSMLAVSRSEWAFKNVLYVTGGMQLAEDGQGYVQHPDVWRFAPGDMSRDGWYKMHDLPPNLAAYDAVEVGPSHMLVLAEKNSTSARTLNEVARRDAANSFFSYHRITETWVDLTGGEPVHGGEMFKSGEDFIWIGLSKVRGLVAADEGRTLQDVIVGGAEKGKLEYKARHFSSVDFLVIGLYIVVMMWVGTRAARRDRDTDDYFLGGRKIPWWVAGVSIYATGISAISFMAIPAKTYSLDWSYICLGIFPPFLVFIAAYTFVPLLRGLNITTMMEYMEMRFGKSVRTLNTLIMVIIQIGGRMSVTLLLPAIALSAVTGWNIYACVLVMGVLATIYTVVGGISAVIWTDFAQVCVIFGGAILSFVLICWNVDGGLGGVIDIGMNFDKFRSFDFAWDFTVPTFWVFTVWALADLFGKLGQEGMQRAFSTKDVSSARKSMITMAILSVPGTLLFYALGAALFAYYHQNPGDLNPNLKTDATFPLFIAQQLPVGVAGLVIAGLFAAAMSTLDSGMNSVATVITRDFYAAFRKDTSEAERLKVARWITLIAGSIGTLLALYMASFELPSLWDTFSKIMGLIGGGFGGVIVLALLTKRTNTAGALIGTIFGTIMMISLEAKVFGFRVSFFMYGTLSMAICIITGYFFSLITPTKPKDLTGLTLWTIPKKRKEQLEQ
ncbi:MAG: sodium:solute symporter family transporter [Phycisphaerae bacterium]